MIKAWQTHTDFGCAALSGLHCSSRSGLRLWPTEFWTMWAFRPGNTAFRTHNVQPERCEHL